MIPASRHARRPGIPWFNHRMPSLANIVRRRRDRRRDHQRDRAGFLRFGVVTIGGIFSVLLAALIVMLAVAYTDLTRDLPNVQQLSTLLNPPDGLLMQPTRLYDRTGAHLLQTLASTDAPRRYLPLNPQSPQHLPPALGDALVVLADPGFWVHSWILPKGMAAALPASDSGSGPRVRSPAARRGALHSARLARTPPRRAGHASVWAHTDPGMDPELGGLWKPCLRGRGRGAVVLEQVRR